MAIHTFTYTPTHVHMHTYNTHFYTQAYTLTHLYTQTLTHTHFHIHTYTYVHVHFHIHTQICILERYADKELIKIHMNSKVYKAFQPKLAALLEAKLATTSIQFYDETSIGFGSRL